MEPHVDGVVVAVVQIGELPVVRAQIELPEYRRDGHHGPTVEAILLAGCSDEIARLRELVDRRLRTRPADYSRIFGDLLALEGQYHWSVSLEDFTDDFYTVSCLHCGAEVTIAVSDYGCYSAIRDWDRGDIEQRALRPIPAEELAGPGQWMHATAVRDGQRRLAEGIRHIFGRAECPACVSVFSVAEAHTRENLSPSFEAS